MLGVTRTFALCFVCEYLAIPRVTLQKTKRYFLVLLLLPLKQERNWRAEGCVYTFQEALPLYFEKLQKWDEAFLGAPFCS